MNVACYPAGTSVCFSLCNLNKLETLAHVNFGVCVLIASACRIRAPGLLMFLPPIVGFPGMRVAGDKLVLP